MTVKVRVQVATFPARSVTVSVTVVRPAPARDPNTGDWVMTKLLAAEQSSEAITLAVKSGTAAWQLALAETD